MKPKLSQPTSVCCYCVLSESHCSSMSQCPLFFPLCFLLWNISFLFILLTQSIFIWLFCVLSILSTFSYPTFSLSCGLSAFKGFTYVQEKVATFRWWVFIQNCCGILKPFMACCLKSVELRRGSTKPAITHGRRDQGRNESSVISMIHNPYLKPRWGFRSTSESSCQQPITACPSDCSLSKQARGTLRPTGIGGFLSLCTQLVVSEINRHLPAITGVVLWAAVWPDVWPRCDYSLC